MPQQFTSRPEIRGTFGAVASTHWIASAVGMGILERGGNAFDAAVAMGFTLQIVEPHLNGPGGEVPILFMRGDAYAPQALCGQGTAPASATIDWFTRRGHRLIPGTGLLPAVVPGAFDAWMLLLRDHGTLSLRTVMEAAIGYANNGFPAAYRVAGSIHAIKDYFATHWPHSAEVWLPNGQPPRPGQLIRTPQIASTYERIVREAEAVGKDRERQIEAARRAFYKGFVAEAIDDYFRRPSMDSTGSANAGLLTGDDLHNWQATYESTLSMDYAGETIHKTGPWGQGPVLLQALGMLAGVDLEAMDTTGPQFVHTVVEVMKCCLADRDAYYGDPDFGDVPIDTLLSPAYLAKRLATIGEQAGETFSPGGMAATDGRVASLLALAGCEAAIDFGGGEPTFTDLPEVEGDTVHLDAVDRWGNLVSATPSGGWLQSSPAVPPLGFNISTRGQMFWLDASLPAALRPRSRPRTTLTPTLVSRDGKPRLGIGSPGGDQQDQWTLAVLLRHFHHRRRLPNLQSAIDAPLFHSAHYINSFYPRAFTPATLVIERRFSEAARLNLAERGHRINVQDDWSIGRVCAAGYDNHMVRAAATPRFMQAYAIGR